MNPKESRATTNSRQIGGERATGCLVSDRVGGKEKKGGPPIEKLFRERTARSKNTFTGEIGRKFKAPV